MRRFLQSLARSSDAGAELVEYALLAPLLLLLLFGMADFGLAFQAYEVVSGAAREGARMGVMACDDGSENCYSATDVRNRVVAFIDAGLPANHAAPTITAECVTVNPGAGGPSFRGERVTVVYQYNFQFIGGVARLVGGAFSNIPMTSIATMRRENQSLCP